MTRMLVPKTRIAWIDTAKAIAMFLIVYGHIDLGGYAHAFVYAFHVPVFIFLSGFCFRDGEEGFVPFLKKKARRILVPYAFFGLFAIAAYSVLGKVFSDGEVLTVKECVIGLLLGSMKSNYLAFNRHLWFLPFFFVLSIGFYWFKKSSDFLTKKARVNPVIGYAALFVISMVISALILNRNIKFYLPFGTDTAVRNLPFFAVGFLAKSCGRFDDELDRKNKKQVLCGFIVFILSTGLLMIFSFKNIHHNKGEIFTVLYNRDLYGNALYFYLAAFFGIVAVTALSRLLPPFKPLTYFGKNTMAVLVLQKFAIMPIRFILDQLPDSVGDNRIVFLLSSCVAILLCLAADRVIQKYFPFLYGNGFSQRKTKKK